MKVIAWIVLGWVVTILLGMVLRAEIGTTSTPEAAWNHSASSNIVGRYEVHYGQTARRTNDPIYERGYTATSAVPRFFSRALLTNLAPGIWFVSVVAISTNGIPSLYSTNEAVYTNRGDAPVNLRILPGPLYYLQASPSAAGPWTDIAAISNAPVLLTKQERQMLRLRIATNSPAPPGP